MSRLVIILAVLAAVCSALPDGGHHGGGHHGGGFAGGYGAHGGHKGHGKGHFAHPRYDFSYGVKDDHYGPNFGHSESRDGYNTKGQYYVHLPDGRVQKVSYYVDEWGYHPTVTYEGKAHFPVHKKGHKGGYY